ncbi:SAM-dependent methyltransferase [Actinoplanes sp. N902-109]|uniref:SAM-dependent methyltransferase n=1 Tax=Actinoplanes sp. (strain N902-109) TaxID=649831 RepID=UPI000329674E|nr:SAM-dependent methyltransferase [Actinoplanes sp. N902-109]AGL17308.1 hypothetical protein L083_3798 [Actinoplanes sp. N902-109]
MMDPGEIPHAARIWNYWMGGTHHSTADRVAGDAVEQAYPEIAALARQSRRFLVRVVRHLTRAVGVRQFLDIGTGLPTAQSTHQVAQSIARDARVVYVDNDPLVLDTTGELPRGVSFLEADYREPERIRAGAATLLDLTRPVAVMFMGVLGYEPSFAAVRSIVTRTMAGTAPGSFLTLWDGTDDTPAVPTGRRRLVEGAAPPYVLRRPQQLERLFDGLTLIRPGLVPLTAWRPERVITEHVDAYGAVARKDS